MGFLKNIFRRAAAVQALPTGSLTVDRHGAIVTCTVSSAYPATLLAAIGHEVIALLHAARTAQLPLTEINLHFGSLHITARELRGGAVIFLLPQTASSAAPKPPRL
jgi:hypothetical protein